MKKYITTFLVMAGFSFLAFACNGQGTDDVSEFMQIEPPAFNPDDPVTFEVLTTQVLGPRCLRCHGEFADENEIIKQTFPKNPEESPLFILTSTGQMPPRGPKLTADELNIIRRYIETL